jgi:hypothetical protein
MIMDTEKKGVVERKISRIIKKYNIREKLDPMDSNYIFLLLEKSISLCYIIPSHYYLYIDNYSVKNFRKVKMLFASDGQRKLPLSKSKLIEELFPTKSKLSPEEKHIGDVKRAARNIIEIQIKMYRDCIKLPITCPLSQKKLTNWKLIHIDHKEPFINLFNDWLETNNINPQEIKLSGPQNQKTFKEETLKNSWYKYHLENAVLQCVYSKANLKKSNKIL